MSSSFYENAIFAYKCASLIGLENICPTLAVLIERDTGVKLDDYDKYELPASDKSNEVMSVIYIFKFFEYFHNKGLNDRIEEYLNICDRFVNFVSGKTGIEKYKLLLEVDKHLEV